MIVTKRRMIMALARGMMQKPIDLHIRVNVPAEQYNSDHA
jgi:hypothetical protein